jgi:hypothetical protein
MDHSKNHDVGKIQAKIDRKGLVRCPHPPYFPDLSPCDFWFFGMVKEKIKDCKFRTVQDILRRLTEICNNLTFEDVQSVFSEWQIRINWVMHISVCFDHLFSFTFLPSAFAHFSVLSFILLFCFSLLYFCFSDLYCRIPGRGVICYI